MELGISTAQMEALSFLANVYGEPTHVNKHKPERAIWADFGPCEPYPYGSHWRIEPDGTVEDVTEAILGLETLDGPS